MKKQTTKSAQFMSEEEMDLIREMSDSEMNSLLVEMSDTRAWLAILKYNFSRLQLADHALHTTDPFKDPTSMARYQGIINGITDLPEMVSMLTTKSSKQSKSEDLPDSLDASSPEKDN